MLAAWWYSPRVCATRGVLDRYLAAIEHVERAYGTASQASVDLGAARWCIRYAEEPGGHAVVWLTLPSRRYLGYVVPVGLYAAADRRFRGMFVAHLADEIQAVGHERFRAHVATRLDDLGLPSGIGMDR